MRKISVLAGVGILVVACQQAPPAVEEPPPPDPAAVAAAQVERGKYLVTIAACHDCHTPKAMTDKGPAPDMSRELSGHPADSKLPERLPFDMVTPGKWGTVANEHLTAWVGVWGVSFTRNLTPHPATGLGSWTEEMFIKTIRNGKQQGEGRDLLPPMPWQMYAQMTDEDLKAVWAYLRSLPPIDNAVPDPIAPAGPPPGAPPAPS